MGAVTVTAGTQLSSQLWGTLDTSLRSTAVWSLGPQGLGPERGPKSHGNSKDRLPPQAGAGGLQKRNCPFQGLLFRRQSFQKVQHVSPRPP